MVRNVLHRIVILTLFFLVAISSAAIAADSDDVIEKKDVELAVDDIFGVIDAILEHHYRSPTRQQMVLEAMRELRQKTQEKQADDSGLATLVSNARDEAALRGLVADCCGSQSHIDLVRPATAGISRCIVGDVSIDTVKNHRVNEQFAANRYVGIGIAAKRDEESNHLVIAKVMEGGPCEAAGLVEGTHVLKVDGWETTTAESLVEIIDRLRGPEGSTVQLEVNVPSENETRVVELTRGVVPLKNVTFTQKGDHLVIHIGQLSSSVPHELRQWAASHDPPAKIVLDLQGTTSGDVHNTVLIADELLDEGTIGSVKDGQREQSFSARPSSVFPGVPMEVRIGLDTSGTTEWLAATLIENHRAVAIGEMSAGAALGMTSHNLPSAQIVAQIPTTKLLSPSGKEFLASEAGPFIPTQPGKDDPPAGRLVPDSFIELLKGWYRQQMGPNSPTTIEVIKPSRVEPVPSRSEP